MIKVRRISHATFDTPDLERQIDYYTGVVGLKPLAKDKDSALFVSRLGDLSVVLQRAVTPWLSKVAFQVAPQDELPALAPYLPDAAIIDELVEQGHG